MHSGHWQEREGRRTPGARELLARVGEQCPPPLISSCSDTLTPWLGGAAWEMALSVASRLLISGSALLPHNPPAGGSSSEKSLNILVNSLPMPTMTGVTEAWN